MPTKPWLWCLSLVVLLSGCTGSPAESKLSGVLTWEGEPLDNCLLTFLPQQTTSIAAASAVTDAQGRYELRTNDEYRRGIPVGDYIVTVQDLSVSTGVVRRDRGTIEDSIPAEPPQPPRPSRVPSRYADASQTKLRVNAQSGAQVFEINLPQAGGS